MSTELLRTLATNFGSNSVRYAQAMREMYRLDPIGFPPAVLEVISAEPDLPGAQFMVAMLASEPDWLRSICDPEKHTLDQSLDLLQRAHKLDPQVEIKLAEMLGLRGASTDAEARFASRVFAVLKGSRPVVALPALRHLAKCREARIRSKAVLMIGRIYQNPKFVHHAESEQDPRVAANGVEALWGMATADAREVFVKAALDAHHRIAANGIVGLYLMGDECSIPFLFNLSTSEKPLSRAAAAWAMGYIEDPRFVERLSRLRQDTDPATRQGAFRSIARVQQKLTQVRAAGALEVQLTDCESQDDGHVVRFTVNKEGEFVGGLDLRQFVVWNGQEVVEECTASLQEGASQHYEIEFQAPPSATKLVKVQVYAASGVGEDNGPERTSGSARLEKR
jgi:hypothetical protein